ncbi:MAG: hypothetical protein AAF542_05655 [Pseudomonadota bacterium]
MSAIESEANSLDEYIPDYVLGRVDAQRRQQIEELMQRDKRFEKQVRVEQALVASLGTEQNTAEVNAANFDALLQRIDAEDRQSNSSQSRYSLPAIAAAVLFVIVALPLMVQKDDPATNEFEALSAPVSAPEHEHKMLRVIFSDGISEHRRDEIALQYNLEVIDAAGALNSIVYKLPKQTPAEQLLNALKQEQSVEFVSLTGAVE